MSIYILKETSHLILLAFCRASESPEDWQNNSSFLYQQEIMLGRNDENTKLNKKFPNLSDFITLPLKSLKNFKSSFGQEETECSPVELILHSKWPPLALVGSVWGEERDRVGMSTSLWRKKPKSGIFLTHSPPYFGYWSFLNWFGYTGWPASPGRPSVSATADEQPLNWPSPQSINGLAYRPQTSPTLCD